MTNKTKKSKWLKLALISTATVSTLATIPAAICAKTSTTTSKLEAASYVQLTFKLRKADKDAGATISGQTITKITKGDYFGSIKKPKVVKEGYEFLGWSESDTEQTTEKILSDKDTIDAKTTVYAVFSKTKMTLTFPESSDGEYQWTYDDGPVTFTFRKGTKWSQITNKPIPKWAKPASGKIQVWDGDWYLTKQTSTEERDPIDPATVLTDGMEIYPGWKDVDASDITVSGPEDVSVTETVQYQAKVHPETMSQDVDWYVTDEEEWDPAVGPKSDYGTIDKETGVFTCTGYKDMISESGEFYVFALAKGSQVPDGISPGSTPNIITVNIVSPESNPRLMHNVIIKRESATSVLGYEYIKVEPQQFYPAHTGNIKGWKLGEDDREPTQDLGLKETFNYEIRVGHGISIINDNFLSGFTSLTQRIVLSDYIKYIGSNFFNGNSIFNAYVRIPSEILHIGEFFMADCSAFNTGLNLESCNNLSYIGNNFLSGCSSYKAGLTVPESVSHIGTGFMEGCASENVVRVDCSDLVFDGSEGSFTGTTEGHTTTIIAGDECNFEELHKKFPDKTTGTKVFRQLVEGHEEKRHIDTPDTIALGFTQYGQGSNSVLAKYHQTLKAKDEDGNLLNATFSLGDASNNAATLKNKSCFEIEKLTDRESVLKIKDVDTTDWTTEEKESLSDSGKLEIKATLADGAVINTNITLNKATVFKWYTSLTDFTFTFTQTEDEEGNFSVKFDSFTPIQLGFTTTDYDTYSFHLDIDSSWLNFAINKNMLIKDTDTMGCVKISASAEPVPLSLEEQEEWKAYFPEDAKTSETNPTTRASVNSNPSLTIDDPHGTYKFIASRNE